LSEIVSTLFDGASINYPIQLKGPIPFPQFLEEKAVKRVEDHQAGRTGFRQALFHGLKNGIPHRQSSVTGGQPSNRLPSKGSDNK